MVVLLFCGRGVGHVFHACASGLFHEIVCWQLQEAAMLERTRVETVLTTAMQQVYHAVCV